MPQSDAAKSTLSNISRFACVAVMSMCLPTGASSAATKSYVLNWIAQAAYSQDGDCGPDGIEPNVDGMYRTILAQMGKSPSEIDKLMEGFVGGQRTAEVDEIVINRGRVNGKPVNVFDNPTAFPDPHVRTVVGKYGIGFNLDEKIGANSFEDPETREKGIDNEYFRAVGCFPVFRAEPPVWRSTEWSYSWEQSRNQLRAWIVSIAGNDLSRDGDVTVTIDRALERSLRDGGNNAQRDQTFRVDPNPRTHNVFKGVLRDGVVTTLEPVNFRMIAGGLMPLQWTIRQSRLKLKLNTDGTLEGMIGGYQPWDEIYFQYAVGAVSEAQRGINMPGLYYNLRRLADGDPDPMTGQNMSISEAFRFQAVPALRAPYPAQTAATQ